MGKYFFKLHYANTVPKKAITNGCYLHGDESVLSPVIEFMIADPEL